MSQTKAPRKSSKASVASGSVERKKRPETIEEEVEIDLNDPFPNMDDNQSFTSALTRDEQGPLLDNMELLSVKKQEIAKQLMSSGFAWIYKLVTGDMSACCSLPASYAEKFGAKSAL